MTAFPSFRLAVPALVFALAGGLSVGPAVAADAAPAKASAGAKPAARSTGKKAPVVVEAPVPDAPPDQVKAAALVYYGAYDCEFSQSVNIAQSAKHSAYVDVRHGKRDWLMKPVLSSTGAIRLEDVRGETLMVQISSKSMLLNVKTAQRIVDDCISPKQRELLAEAKAAKAAAEAAPVKAIAEAATAAAPTTDSTMAAPSATAATSTTTSATSATATTTNPTTTK